jgi:hypothetical protein
VADVTEVMGMTTEAECHQSRIGSEVRGPGGGGQGEEMRWKIPETQRDMAGQNFDPERSSHQVGCRRHALGQTISEEPMWPRTSNSAVSTTLTGEESPLPIKLRDNLGRDGTTLRMAKQGARVIAP